MRHPLHLLSLAALTALGAGCDPAESTMEPAADAAVEAPDASPDVELDVEPATATADPPSGSMAGYFRVAIDLEPVGLDPAAVTAVFVADVETYDPVVDGGRIVVTVQGAPDPGPAAVAVEVGDALHDLGPIFAYDPPLDPRLGRVAAIGASLGQGVQRGVPTTHGALMSPPAQVARHLGAFMPLPVPVPGFLGQITLGDVGPPPECETPDVADFIISQATRALPSLIDPDTGAISLALARVAPGTQPYNLSAGNCRVADVLRGPTDDLPARILSHFVYETHNDPFGPVSRSQLDVLEEIAPDVVISVDLYGNDLINGIVNADALDPDANSPLDALHADLEATLARLAALDAEIFIGDLPRPSVLARAAFRLARAEARGERAEAEARIARIDADVEATNAKLWALAERWPNVHVVGLADRLDALDDGLTLGEVRFDVRRFGGLVGLDGLHFTDTGYALVAEAVVDTIAATLDVDLPPLDLTAVALDDTENPAALRAAGLEPLDCLR